MRTATITATNTDEIAAAHQALSSAGGGTIRVVGGTDPIRLHLQDGGTGHVRIVSADPGDPTLLSQISMDGVSNVTVSGFAVDSTGVDRPEWHKDVMVGGDSRGVTIEDTAFTSDAVGRYSPGYEDAHLGETLALVREVEDFAFNDNTVTGYYQGLTVREARGLEVEGNEFTQLQGDGIRLAGVQDATVSGNHMHDFLGTVARFNHNDFIQVFSAGSTLVTRDLTISDNVLDAGDASSAQGIFIGNEAFRNDPTHVFENIVVTGNLVHGANPNGIVIAAARGSEITDNTLLWASGGTTVHHEGGPDVSIQPAIRLINSTDSRVEGNIAPRIVANGTTDPAQIGDNAIVDYDSPGADNYIDNHLVNASHGGRLGPDDVRIRPDSDWAGQYGSAHSETLTASPDGGVTALFTVSADPHDLQVFELDAGASVDGRGALGDDYQIRWRLEDGTVLEGVTVRHDFGEAGPQAVTLEVLQGGRLQDTFTREVDVPDEQLLDLSLRGAPADGSSYGTSVSATAGASAEGFRLGEGRSVSVSRDHEGLHELGRFDLSLELSVDPGEAGRFVLFHRVMDARVLEDGEVQFTLHTDAGSFELRSEGNRIDDGRFHEVGVAYDGVAGTLALRIDGETVAETDATGLTAQVGSHDLVIGSRWGDYLEGTVRDVRLDATPEGAAELVTVVVEQPTPVTIPVPPAPEPRPVPEAPVAEEPIETPEAAETPELPAPAGPRAPAQTPKPGAPESTPEAAPSDGPTDTAGDVIGDGTSDGNDAPPGLFELLSARVAEDAPAEDMAEARADHANGDWVRNWFEIDGGRVAIRVNRGERIEETDETVLAAPEALPPELDEDDVWVDIAWDWTAAPQEDAEAKAAAEEDLLMGATGKAPEDGLPMDAPEEEDGDWIWGGADPDAEDGLPMVWPAPADPEAPREEPDGLEFVY